MESVLPQPVVTPNSTGEGDYLMDYIRPEIRETVEQSIPRGEFERIQYKQRELHNEIIKFTEAKAREFYDFCDQLVREHHARLAAQRESSSLSTQTQDSPSPPPEVVPSHSSSRTSIRSDSPKVPLKSSFKNKAGSSATSSESESASGQKSPKRVMFASQPEVYTPEESDSEEEDQVSGSDTDDDEVNGVAESLSQHSIDDEPVTDNSARVLNVQQQPEPPQEQDKVYEEEDDTRSTEDLFDFDESLGVEIPPAEDVSTTFRNADQEAEDHIATTTDGHLGLVNPALASSLPQPNMVSSLPRLSGSFRPPAQSKYVPEDIEEGSDPPSRSSTGSIPISTGLAARPTVISPYASSLPIQISQSQPWSLSAQQANDSNHSSVTGATPLPQREQEHMTEDLEWATLLNHGETNDNPFNRSATNKSTTDPSKMSFSERLLLEEQKQPDWDYDV